MADLGCIVKATRLRLDEARGYSTGFYSKVSSRKTTKVANLGCIVKASNPLTSVDLGCIVSDTRSRLDYERGCKAGIPKIPFIQ